MNIEANIKVMNNVTYPHAVIFVADTDYGSLRIKTNSEEIEINRKQLEEFLARTVMNNYK